MATSRSLFLEKNTMNTENWKIEYYMSTKTGEVKINESWAIKLGYHKNIRRFWKESSCVESEKDPIYKIRGNYVELIIAGGRNLPISSQNSLENAVLLFDSQHPIELTAPDKTKYRHTSS